MPFDIGEGRCMETRSMKFPVGFRVGSLNAGIKKTARDLVMISSTKPCNHAAMFTQNVFSAAPVIHGRALLAKNAPVSGLVINSGCANACTGEQGLANSYKMAEIAQEATKGNSFYVMSTGVIGEHLPIDKIVAGIKKLAPQLSDTEVAWKDASEGMMTTDTFPKLRTREVTLTNGQTIQLAGLSKGVGMIHPNMATMLGCICTDAEIESELLQATLRTAVDQSFNCVTVDGDTSTNDAVVLLSNGEANVEISASQPEDLRMFQSALIDLCKELAQLMVRDGEGATKFISVKVTGADSTSEARRVAESIATSALVKTAMFGGDANWGRVVCAAGYSGVDFDQTKVNVYLGAGTDTDIPEGLTSSWELPEDSEIMHLVKGGARYKVDEDKSTAIFQGEDIFVVVDIGKGTEEAVYWTCDFSYEYVKINGEYRT
eukprot:Clim_evm18s230 gene=Clim_evmTU18s230